MKNLYMLMLSLAGLWLTGQQPKDTALDAHTKSELARYQKMMVSGRNVNPNTLNYDLRYQRLELSLDPSATGKITGTVTSHFVPNQKISSIYFDLNDALTVSEVNYKGANIPFSQLTTNELKIDFPTQLNENVLDSISVSYSGTPVNENIIPSYTRARQDNSGSKPYVIYTLSEPYGARDWFPTKQSLNDKIEKVRIEVTTPSGIFVAANGKLISETAISGTQLKTIWQTNYPIPAYLIAIGVTNYNKYTDTIGNPPFPFLNYVYPSNATTTNLNAINATKPMMEHFETYFGPYPYRDEKYGHMEFDFSGGMEHPTMSSMGVWTSLSTTAHELAHQWFGDKTTCKTWNGVWINEGFARFAEHLYNEKITNAGNKTAFTSYLQGIINNITSAPGGSVFVSDANLESLGILFSGRLSYDKGSYLLRMLKWMVGEDAFYQALREYSTNYAYGYASGMDFKSSFETSTGKDFTEFFNDWYFGEGYPIYNINWKQNPDKTVVFQVLQTKSIASAPEFFEMLLPIKIKSASGDVMDVVLDHNVNGQIFAVPVSFTVSSITFNEENQILTKGSTVNNNTSFLSTVSSDKIQPLKLYPNPASYEIKFLGNKEKKPYKIYNLDGKLWQSGVVNANNGINIAALPVGSYMIEIESHQYRWIKK
ncbi:M1 family aminopeptidase [Cloacibacterium sp. TD35]|uniref:M1 family aminopeptidase n=1 Tax=Cloacibacterium sp. TD35 TaxID=2976818 RepID=UPI00237E17C8|nr:M1 family aminopeptidase [Cloacibacterium sp. TD35]WDT68119.1 M1 family aminopeptidase [Cloacibacterium sp. TD35]